MAGSMLNSFPDEYEHLIVDTSPPNWNINSAVIMAGMRTNTNFSTGAWFRRDVGQNLPKLVMLFLHLRLEALFRHLFSGAGLKR